LSAPRELASSQAHYMKFDGKKMIKRRKGEL